MRSQPSNGFRDAAFVWSWLLGVSVNRAVLLSKLHDQELWKRVSTIFHEKKLPEIKVSSKISTKWRKERTVADTFSGDRFLNATPKKRRLGLQFIGLEQVSGINLFDNEILIISSDSKWYKVCYRSTKLNGTVMTFKAQFLQDFAADRLHHSWKGGYVNNNPNISHGILHSKPVCFSSNQTCFIMSSQIFSSIPTNFQTSQSPYLPLPPKFHAHL